MKTTSQFKEKINIMTIIKVSFTLVGTLIGAGFASGKEVTTFFGCFGNVSYLFIFLFCIIFACGIIFFSFIDKNQLPKTLKTAINIAVFISEIISITAMMAGLSSILSILFVNDIPFYLSLVLIFMIVICGLKGLTTTNIILIPFLFISIIVFGVVGVSTADTLELAIINNSKIFKFMSLPLYIGLNLFGVFPIVLEFSGLQNKKEKIFSAITTSTMIFILMLCFCFTILNISSSFIASELPLVVYILTKAPNLIIVVVLTLTIAIITTIISDGFVVRQILSNNGNNFANISFALIFFGAFCVSNFGFAQIVETLYPINGLIGLILISLVIFFGIKNKTLHKKSSEQ
ncbi:MAG: hypothetical protein J6J23_00675 [Clostridia bacterium]|nr:hypothetical protein [Clostridia bacterium]